MYILQAIASAKVVQVLWCKYASPGHNMPTINELLHHFCHRSMDITMQKVYWQNTAANNARKQLIKLFTLNMNLKLTFLDLTLLYLSYQSLWTAIYISNPDPVTASDIPLRPSIWVGVIWHIIWEYSEPVVSHYILSLPKRKEREYWEYLVQ